MYTLTFLLSTLITFTIAQQQYTIDPNSVSNATRNQWCTSQETQCPLICLQTSANSDVTEQNNCDPTTLTYACVCSNGLSPNISEYSLTLPYYVCTEWGVQCVSNCGNDNQCAAACTQDHPCGAQSPKLANTSTITSTTSASASASNAAAVTTAGGTVYTGFAGGSTPSQTAGSGAHSAASGVKMPTIVAFGSGMGALVLMGGLSLGFAVLL